MDSKINIFLHLMGIGDFVVRVTSGNRPAAMRQQVCLYHVVDHITVFVELETCAGIVNDAGAFPGIFVIVHVNGNKRVFR